MKKLLAVLALGSFLGFAVTANACDGHKAKVKASTEKVTGATVATASTAKESKAECTPEQKAACVAKASKDTKAGCGDATVTTTSAEGAKTNKSCCAKKSVTKKS